MMLEEEVISLSKGNTTIYDDELFSSGDMLEEIKALTENFEEINNSEELISSEIDDLKSFETVNNIKIKPIQPLNISQNPNINFLNEFRIIWEFFK